MLKKRVCEGDFILPKTKDLIIAIVDHEDKFLVNRSKCLACTFNKSDIKSIKKLKSFISSQTKLNSHLFEMTTLEGQQVQNLEQVQEVICIRKAKKYWIWDWKFYLMCISSLFALADFALDINTILEYFQIGQKDFGIIMIVLICLNILLRDLSWFFPDPNEDRCSFSKLLRLLYPIFDLDTIITKYNIWKNGEIKSQYVRDANLLLELFLENIPSFFIGVYAMVLKGEINSSILLSVVSSGLLLCINLTFLYMGL